MVAAQVRQPGYQEGCGGLMILAFVWGEFLLAVNISVRYGVLTVLTMRDTMFWGVTLCKLSRIYWQFRGNLSRLDSKLHTERMW
jgi:hypothetical protein